MGIRTTYTDSNKKSHSSHSCCKSFLHSSLKDKEVFEGQQLVLCHMGRRLNIPVNTCTDLRVGGRCRVQRGKHRSSKGKLELQVGLAKANY